MRYFLICVCLHACTLKCVFIYVLMCTCKSVCTCGHVHVEARGQHFVSFYISINFSFWNRILQRAWSSLVWQGCVASDLSISVSISPALRLQMCAIVPDLSQWFWRKKQIRSSCSQSKHFMYWAIFLALDSHLKDEKVGFTCYKPRWDLS